MSDVQVSATALLCRLLELSQPQVNGAELLGADMGDGGRELIHERLLAMGTPLSYVTCSDCEIEMARVVRPIGAEQILLYCDECGEVQTGRELQQTYTVSLPRLIQRLAGSFEFPSASSKVIDNEFSWRLGVQEHKRGKAQTWYFARHLDDHTVAKRLLDQIRADHASQSARILTSTEVPLPDGSPLAGYDVVNLSSVARLTQSLFLFFADRTVSPVQQSVAEVLPATSLRHVRDKAWAFVDGVKYELEGMQQNILLALMDAHGQRLEGNQIGERCGSSSFPFQPAKHFGRIKQVRQAFIQYDPSDKVYELIIHPEDRGLI